MATTSRRKPTGFGVAVASVATFLAVLAVLAWRMSAGEDPALGSGGGGSSGAALAQRNRPVIHRKIVKLRVLHDPPAAGAESSGTGLTGVPAPAGATAVVPVGPSSPAPAPAPAPAPPVTSSS